MKKLAITLSLAAFLFAVAIPVVNAKAGDDKKTEAAKSESKDSKSGCCKKTTSCDKGADAKKDEKQPAK